jgi:hypothetical protein
MQDNIPRLKGRVLDDKLTIPVEKTWRNELLQVKLNHGVDVMEWARQVLKREFKELKKRLPEAS